MNKFGMKDNRIFICVLILSIVVIFAGYGPCERQNQVSYTENNKRQIGAVDSIMNKKFQFLYTLVNIQDNPPYDVNMILSRSEAEIVYMERLTGIHCSYPADMLGRIFIYKDDYIRWVNWYFENYEELVFDQAQGIVMRRDR